MAAAPPPGPPAIVTVIGDLLEDVVVWPTGPVIRGTDNAATITRRRGGSAANVAVAVAAAGGAARFIGRVGDDDLGRQLADRLVASGAEVMVQRAGRTGSVVILVDAGGERTMFPDRGAAGELTAVDPAWLSGVAVLHVPAYALASCADPIAAAAEEVRRSGGRVTVDLSAATLIAQIGASEMRTLVGRLEPAVVFANEDEAGALGMFVTADIEDGWSPPWPVTVIKRGARAALVVRRVGRPVTEVPAELVPTVRDTTGAGDAFAGAFLAAWAGGASVESSCRAGHRGAAVVLGHAGAGG